MGAPSRTRCVPAAPHSLLPPKKNPASCGVFIGAPRFELGTSSPPDWRANQAAPRPVSLQPYPLARPPRRAWAEASRVRPAEAAARTAARADPGKRQKSRKRPQRGRYARPVTLVLFRVYDRTLPVTGEPARWLPAPRRGGGPGGGAAPG